MTYTITISDSLYTKARSLAESSDQTVDAIIQRLLTASLDEPRRALPLAEQNELQALTQLSDATLFTIAREQMPPPQQEQMQRLMDKNNKMSLSEDEQQTLASLVEDGQRLTLRKAEALRILVERGHQVNLETLAAQDD